MFIDCDSVVEIFFELKHEYKLMDESGPAHKKRFTVSLILTPDQVPRLKVAVVYIIGVIVNRGIVIGRVIPLSSVLPYEVVVLRESFLCRSGKNPRNPLILLSYVAHHLGFEPNFVEMGAPIYTMPPSFLPAPGRYAISSLLTYIDLELHY
uniref:Uncharacterized protein n=1 Tax=Parascaris equorum TaxID=6256 RepID=A0A914S126_PAREQ